MSKCKVVHFRKEPYDIMIDRTTKWGCPFSHIRDRKTKAFERKKKKRNT